MSEPAVIPEWVVLLIGRQTLENEALRRQVREMAQPPEDDPGD